jgi:hypothetical protein
MEALTLTRIGVQLLALGILLTGAYSRPMVLPPSRANTACRAPLVTRHGLCSTILVRPLRMRAWLFLNLFGSGSRDHPTDIMHPTWGWLLTSNKTTSCQ